MWSHLFLSRLHEVIELRSQGCVVSCWLSALCPLGPCMSSAWQLQTLNLGPAFLPFLWNSSSSSLYPAQCLARYVFIKQISDHKAWSLTSPKFTTKIRLWVAQKKLYPFTNGMTLFSLFQLVEGEKLIISYVECNWIILLKMITAVTNYICMMELQHYWIFGQICRQIIVLTPKWCIQGFVNARVSDAMEMHNETWTKSKMSTYHLVSLFFLYQIKLVFFHQLIKKFLMRWEIQLKGMPEKPKHYW